MPTPQAYSMTSPPTVVNGVVVVGSSVADNSRGEQFVAIAVGGGGAWGSGDHVVAFRLRRGAARPTRAGRL